MIMICTMFFSIFQSIITLLAITFLYKVVWIPFRVQRTMRSRGISGPSYKLFHGTTKEGMMLKQQAKKCPPDGLSHDIFPRLQPQFYTWMNLYGRNFLTWTGIQPHLVITEAELAKEILNNKQGCFRKIKAKGYVKKLLGDGLAVAEGAKWLKLRKIANHAFYADILKDMIPDMIASVETMLEKWKQHDGRELEVCREFTLLTSEVISRTAFGSSYVEGKNIFDMLSKLGYLIYKNGDKIRFGIEKIWKSGDEVESDKIEQSLIETALSIVRKREEQMGTGETENYGSDFLGALLRVHHDSDKKNRISIDDVIDECKVFFLAGHETTNSLLTWTFLLLAIHTDWQEKAKQEVVALFGQENPTSEGLSKMNSQHDHPRGVEALLPCNEFDTKSGDEHEAWKIRDMELHIPTLALDRDPEIWGQDAHLFKPERFEAGVGAATRNNPMAFSPFGSGQRTCVGLNFANNEAKIALSMSLQRYSFTLSSTYVHSPHSLITTRPRTTTWD